MTQDRHFAGSGCEQAFQNFDRRGLPRAVRPEQAEAFAGLDLEVQPTHSLDFAVISLAQIAALDGGGHAVHSNV